MCTKTPKPAPVEEKKPQYLRNPLLDGLAIGGGQAQGRNSLRIDRVTPTPQLPAPVAPTPALPPPGIVIPTTPRIPRDPRGRIGVIR